MVGRLLAIAMWVTAGIALGLMLPTVAPFASDNVVVQLLGDVGSALALIDSFVDTFYLLWCISTLAATVTVSLGVWFGFWLIENWKH